MALTDVVFGTGNSAVAARGNVGSLTDILSSQIAGARRLVVPATTDVKSGVTYGQDGTALTGSYVGGGGGSTGVSRGRVTNA